MTKINEQLEKYLSDYIINEHAEKLFKKSPNSLSTRQYIKNPRGKAARIEPEALAERLLQRQTRKTLESLTGAMTPEAYANVRQNYPLSDDGINEYYVSMIRYGMLPELDKSNKKQNKELGELAGLVAGHYAIIESLENKDVNQAVEIVQRLAGLSPEDADIAYDYAGLGNQPMASYMARDFANIAKRVAISKLTPEYKAMIEKEAEKDAMSRARSAAETFKLYQNKELKGKKLKAAGKAKGKRK